MTDREQYTPGPASGAEVRKDGEKWTLILVRELRHPPAMVWQALTDPAHLSEWAPFDADRNLAAVRLGGWQRLNAEYARQFGIETPNWPPNAAKR